MATSRANEPQTQFARTDEGVIPQRSEFLERHIPRDQQPHSATVLNGRPQQPHQLDKVWLGLRFLPEDFFEPLEFIQTEQNAIPSGPMFELFQPIPRGFQRRVPQPSERVPVPRPSLLSQSLFTNRRVTRIIFTVVSSRLCTITSSLAE